MWDTSDHARGADREIKIFLGRGAVVAWRGKSSRGHHGEIGEVDTETNRLEG